ncbi:outer membrane protein assembly factor BamA [Thermodesulfobacteriota bacterium]
MLRYLTLLLIVTMVLLPNTVNSQETARVIVLPFKVHAQEDFSYMEAEIPQLIRKHLKMEGATVIDPDIVSEFSWEETAESIDDIRNIGIQNGADYVVWGSLTWIGKKYSLDAKMIEPFGEGPPKVFFVEGEDVENLLGTVKELSQNLGIKLFKRERVAEILVTGNERIESDAIKRVIKTEPDDIYLAKNLSKDLKAVYAMGYFEDVRIESESGPEGRTIIFKVTEKSTIRRISVTGNRIYEAEKIMENIDITRGSILNIFRINRNVKRIEELYKDKNYHNVQVTHKIHEREQNQADLEFIINEGKKLLIQKIIFQGNSAYTDKRLKKIMKTSEKGFFSWATSSGDLNRDNLEQDMARLSAFYHNNGYVKARVGEPQIEFKDKQIDITIKIDEGSQFKVGTVEIAGDLVLPKEALLEKVKITKETYYNRETLRDDVLVLTDLYSDEGYAYADIAPRIETDSDNLKVNITYVVEKGKQVYFEKIIIGGNTKTRDKVIRRQLRVYEQEVYSGKRLKRGINNLYRTDYFEDIKVNTEKGSSDDKMILKVDVTEKPTGTFTFGGGFSSVDEAFFVASVQQRNLFGRGQILGLRAQLGSVSNRYTISFTEPWLFDIPLAGTISVYNWDRDYDIYEKESVGGSIRFGYPIFNYTRASIGYLYDDSEITDIDPNASDLIKDIEGTNRTSSVMTAIRYDSRDRAFNPTKGQKHELSLQYAGLGGTIGFTKAMGAAGVYIPLFWETVGFLHGAAGFVTRNSEKTLPDYEKFYLGGMHTVRGFDWRDISAYDEEGKKVGGEKMVFFNVEYIIPLLKKVGIVLVAFFDTGNVWGTGPGQNVDVGDLRQGAGWGIRWYSPMGPLRLEQGYILDPEPGESTKGTWEFSMGGTF